MRPQVVAFYGSPRQALAAISHADLVVGMRLHSLIFAASAGVPGVAIDYDPKVRAMAERTGNGYVVSVDAPPEEIAQVVLDAWAQRDKLRAELAGRVPDLKRQARDAAGLALLPIVDKQAEHGRARVLGVPVDCVSMEEAVEKVAEMAVSGRGGHVVTLNPEMTLSAGEDAALEAVIAGADLVVPDGIGVVRALKMLGYCPRGRVPGIELAANVMGTAAERGMSVYFVGAKPGVAQQAADAMSSALPGLRIAGAHHGTSLRPRSRCFGKDRPIRRCVRLRGYGRGQTGEMDSACAPCGTVRGMDRCGRLVRCDVGQCEAGACGLSEIGA